MEQDRTYVFSSASEFEDSDSEYLEEETEESEDISEDSESEKKYYLSFFHVNFFIIFDFIIKW